MKFISFVAGIVLLLSTPANASEARQHSYGKYTYTIDPAIPTWITPLKSYRSRGQPQGQAVEYIQLDTQILAEPGNHQKYTANSLFLHNSQAVSGGSEIHVQFNPDYQQLVFHKIELIRKGATLNMLKPEIVRLLQQEEDLRNGIYHGAVTAVAIVPNTRPGDRLNYSYSVLGRNPVYQGKIFGAQTLGWSVDVGYTRLRLLVPKGTPLQTRVHNLELKSHKKNVGTYTEYSWVTKAIEGRADEGNYPAWYVRYPFLEYSEFETWQDVEAWAESLYGALDQSSPEMEALVRKLAKQHPNDADYALAALDFTQEQIRYLGLEFGQNSHLPHSPAEVLSNRYGDCKDKSNLLVQLLRKHGISAWPTLVSYEYQGGFTRFLPSPLAFDHVIVAALIDGQRVWLDPTRTLQTGRLQDLAFLNFDAGLMIGTHNKPISHITPLTDQQERVQVTEHFEVGTASKPVHLTIESRFTGAGAEYQRYMFGNTSLDEIQTLFINYYAKIYPSIRTRKPLRFTDDSDHNSFVTIESYDIPDFLESKDEYYVTSYFASGIHQSLERPEQIRRESPVDIGNPRHVTHKIIVDFKKAVEMTIDSTPLIKKTPEMEYRSRSVLLGQRFEHTADLLVNRGWVEGADVDNYVRLTNDIKKDIEFNLTFRYPYKPPTASTAVKQLIHALEP